MRSAKSKELALNRFNVACKPEFLTLKDVPCRVPQGSFLVLEEGL